MVQYVCQRQTQLLTVLTRIHAFRKESFQHVRLQSTQSQPRATSHLARNSVKSHPIEMIRNIGIMAHIDAGKTTTTERMLFYSGYTRSLGDVDDGDTVMDYMEQERDRGITITSAAITFPWNKHRINLIDTPGHVDFTLEVERSLRVLDGAVAILDASAGVEAQTLTVWRQAERYEVPCIAYLNKMDKPKASFEMSVKSMMEKLHVNPLIVQLPVGNGSKFQGVVDIVNLEMFVWSHESEGKSFKKLELETSDSALYNEVMDTRTKLVENLADFDEVIADHVLSDTDHMDIPKGHIHRAIRNATIERKGVPVLCGSSFKNKGVQPLMDSVIRYLPSPVDIQHSFVDHYQNDLCGLAFKLVHDKHHGPLTFVRLYSGEISGGSTIYNINRGCNEKVQRLMQVYADEHKEVHTISKGNIIAVAGLKETITGDTLVSSLSSAKAANKRSTNTSDGNVDDESTAPVLAGLVIPDPVFFCSIEVASLVYQKQLDLALANLSREDPSLRVHVDKDTGQTILSGMGELHLDIIKSRIEKEYKAEVDLGPLQISYREAIQNHAEERLELDKMIGKDRHRVNLTLSVSPSEETEFKSVELIPHKDSEMDPKRVRRHVIQAINKGVQSALSRGPVLGFPVLNVSVQVHDIKVKYGTSLPMVTGAAAQATHKALLSAGGVLLEPFMLMDIWTEESYLSNVMSDLSPRRAQIQEISAPHQDTRNVHALVPLSELLGYSNTLRTITSGRGSFSMSLSHYSHMGEYEQKQAMQRITGFVSN